MDHIMTYEEYLRDVKKGIVTDLGNSPVTPLLLMLQGKWKTQILYELCIHDTVSAVLYRCEATEVNIPYHYDDGNVHMNHVIRLKNLDQYNPSFLPFDQTGIPPARLLALVWAHNSDLLNSYPHYSIKITTLYITFVTYNAVTFIFFDTPNKTYSCIR